MRSASILAWFPATTALVLRIRTACASTGPARPRSLRRNWLRLIGAPDYQTYLAHHAAHHPGHPPMSERAYVAFFIEHRFNRRGAGRCC